jgi:peptidoglycan/LPS O-acetylase OafA/YrhL
MSANLDLLRAIAVLLVLAQHLLRRADIAAVGPVPVETLGYFGVLLFFVHTSLVLMYSLQRSAMDPRLRLISNFYIRRFFRIYPLSTVAILAALTLSVTTMGPIHGLAVTVRPAPFAVVSNLLMVQNVTQAPSIINVLWSLPFEIQMYVLLPFLFVWIGKRQMPFWSLLALWTLSVLAAEIQPHITWLSRLTILRFTPNFLPGVIAFAVARSAGGSAVRLKSFLWPALILLLTSIFTQAPGFRTGWVLCLMLGLSLPFFREISNRSLRAVSHWIATYSYGIYLSHPFAIWIAYGVMTGWSLWLRIPVLVILLVGLPVLLYHTIERPMIQMGRTLAEGSSQRRTLLSRAVAAAD